MIRRAVVLIAVALLSACGERTPVDHAAAVTADAASVTARIANRHLRRQLLSQPRTLDPSLSTDVQGQQLMDDLFEGLVRLDARGTIVPAVAKSWDRSSDGLDWTFHLDPQARWSNGERVTADDFVFAWRRIVNPATAAQAGQQLAPIVNAQAIGTGKLPPESLGARAIDAETLQVRLVAPTPYFLYLLTTNYLLPLPRASVEQYGAAWTQPGKLVSNGAFVLEDLRINGAIQLRRNTHYRDAAAVRLQQVTWYPVGDNAAITARYLAGDLDVTDGFGLNDLAWLRERLGKEVLLAPYYGIVMLGFNVQRPPFNSRALRLALTMAVDRDLLTHKLLHDVYLPAYNLVPPSEGYEPMLPDWSRLSEADRHARARELYAAAGYSKDHPLVVDLSFPSGSPDSRRVFEALTAMWRVNLGAEVRLYSDEWRVHQQNRQLGKYDLFWHAWIGDYLDPLTFLQLMQRDSGNNHSRYSNPAYEQIVSTAIGSGSEESRMRGYRDAEAVLNDDAPFIPIYFYQSRHLVKSYVQGWRTSVVDRNPSRNLYLAAQPES